MFVVVAVAVVVVATSDDELTGDDIGLSLRQSSKSHNRKTQRDGWERPQNQSIKHWRKRKHPLSTLCYVLDALIVGWQNQCKHF